MSGPDFEFFAASLKADAHDIDLFLGAVAAKLEGALPQRTRVERKSVKFLSKDKKVVSVEVDLGESGYALSRGRSDVEARRTKIVRGITLKNEILPVHEWIDHLVRDLAEMAASNEQSRLALEGMLGVG